MQVLGILDVSETEDSAKEAEEENGDFVDPGTVLLKFAHVSIGDERNALVERLGAGDILQAHRAVHIDNENAHDGVLDPRRGNSVCNLAQLKLLADVKGAFLVGQVGVVGSTRELGCLVTLLSKDGVATPIRVQTICH